MSISARNNICKSLFFIILSLLIGCATRASKTYPTIQIPEADFRSADLALRLGRSIESDLIARGGESDNRYSHIGLLIESDSGMIVVDIEPSTDKESEQIKAQSVSNFFNSQKAIAGTIMRYDGLDSTQINMLKNKAIELLNSSITFDHDYQQSDNSKMYCTELIEVLFNAINISLSENRNRTLPLAKEPVIIPSDISQNRNLKRIWSYDLRFLADSIR
ncbi:MAG: hypothetical protein IKM69_03170 [Alistipes sp.]|nr:hypothetical protein [Alistipes sp.]